jgi:hypothetical protein
MKDITKSRIIRFIKRIIKYEDTAIKPFIVEKRIDIQVVRYQSKFNKQDMEVISEEQLQYMIIWGLVDCLMTKGQIMYTKEKEGDYTLIEAKLKYIKEC